MTEIHFIIFDCPDCARIIQMEIAPGTTKLEFVKQCVQFPGVTATEKQLYVSNCFADKVFRSDSYVFTGKEKEVVFMDAVSGG